MIGQLLRLLLPWCRDLRPPIRVPEANPIDMDQERRVAQIDRHAAKGVRQHVVLARHSLESLRQEVDVRTQTISDQLEKAANLAKGDTG